MVSNLIFALLEEIFKGFMVYCLIASIMTYYWKEEEVEKTVNKGFSIFAIVLSILWWGGCITTVIEELLNK
ncbi:MAG: hypothetical protein QXG39_02105 [Candidatus Aenigmatarchaeota archaeon]